MGRIARSWELFKASWSVLKTDKELAILPLISGLVMLVVCASFVLGMGLHRGAPDELETRHVLPTLLFYVVSSCVAFFFQAALVAGALERLSGGDPTLGSSLRAAARRLGPILMWGAVAGTVGMLLRAIQERSNALGKIVTGLIGVAWSLATYFMVPVLVMEKRPLGDSFRASWTLFKKTWGESVVGNLGLGLFGFLGFLLVGGLTALLVKVGLTIVAVIFAVVGFVTLMCVLSALSGIWLAAVYRYATTGQVSGGFDREALVGAFRAK